MKFSNTIKTVLKIYQKYVKNSVWFGTGGRQPKITVKKVTIKISLTKLVILETNNYLTYESNLNTTYLSSLQLAIAKGHTDLQLCVFGDYTH